MMMMQENNSQEDIQPEAKKPTRTPRKRVSLTVDAPKTLEPIKAKEVKVAYPATAFRNVTHERPQIGMMRHREAYIMKKLGL